MATALDVTTLSPAALAAGVKCRFCGSRLEHTFVDLGMSPLCESFVPRERLDGMEPFYPLRAYVCGGCYLVQLSEYVSATDIFGGEYAYFSSYSDSWVAHARRYAHEMIERLGLSAESQVVEIASNDGYLLQHFVEQGIPALGIEPAENVSDAARKKGIATLNRFFGTETARDLVSSGLSADLLLGNNVLAHVPDLNDFVEGLRILLNPRGVITMEFPHLMRLIDDNQFDTIYHEHFCYLSFGAARRVFAAHGLKIFDVEELPTHGGSLRIFAAHENDDSKPPTAHVETMLSRERADGYEGLARYTGFQRQVDETKFALLDYLISARRQGLRVVGYGAPGKGNTLLNYCGIRRDLLDYTVDRSTFKHGKFLPGTRIPIHAPDKIDETRPDRVLILPWNLRDEITSQMSHIRDWGGKFVVPIPRVAEC